MKILCLWVISICLLPSFCWGDTYPKNPDIDVLHYAFDLTLSDETDLIRATAAIRVQFKTEGIDRLRLDFIRKSEEMEGKGMVVTGITSESQPLEYTHDAQVLWISLPRPSVAREDRTIVIQYEGIPATGLIIGPNKYGDRTFFSDNWPNKARNWLPTVDHPYDKATCEFRVTAPLHYQVVSNGLKAEESIMGEGMRLTHWKQSVPISCWLYMLGVAEFAVQYVDTFEGKSIQTWVYKQDRVKGFYDFAVPTKHMLEFLSDYVGPFVYEKLANIQSNSVGGGMEAASAILYYDRLTGERDEQLRNIIIHEVAHQWFGNAVTEYDWDDVWLSEGLTTYFTLRFIEHAYGRDAFVEGLIKARNQAFQLSENNEDYRIVHDNLSDMSKVTSGLTYQKGAWVAHMLCNYIGEEAFHQGIRNYYHRFINSHATTADLKSAMEETSGKNLDEFFTQWLYQGGNIRLEGTWKYNAENKMIEVELTQVQPQPYTFNMPLEIGVSIEEASAEKIEVINLNKRKVNVSIPSATIPTRVRLDPRIVLLAEWDFIQKK